MRGRQKEQMLISVVDRKTTKGYVRAVMTLLMPPSPRDREIISLQ